MTKKIKAPGKLKSLIIDRRRWLRGGTGALQDESGMRCCLGFASLKLGAKEKDIIGILLPERLDSGFRKRCRTNNNWLIGIVNGQYNNSIVAGASIINDDKSISDFEREIYLKEIFASRGCKLIFRN